MGEPCSAEVEQIQRIALVHAQPGMTVARNIFNADGQMLLAEGVILKEAFIARLRTLGVGSVYIKNPYFNYEVPEIIKEETRTRAIGTVKDAFDRFSGKPSKFEMKKLKQTILTIIDQVIQNRDTLVHMTDIRAHDDYTFGHSVNVCMLSLMIGVGMNYGDAELREIALGAMLHDMGKTIIPVEILNKPEKLNELEMEIVKKHTHEGFEILRQNKEIPLLAAHIAFQHHEKYDGTGYPRKLKGTNIHEYARIVTIADVYDALTSDRAYRPALLQHEAYELMMASAGTHFDIELLQKFFEKIAIYPMGSTVILNTGEIGIITEVPASLPSRPTVKVIANSNRQRLTLPYEIKLINHLTTFIVAVLKNDEAACWAGNTVEASC